MRFTHWLASAAILATGVAAQAQQTPTVLWRNVRATDAQFLRTVVWSPDGLLLASGAGNVSVVLGNVGELTLWRSMDGQLLNRRSRNSILRLNGLVFHPSGHWIFTAEGQGPDSTWAVSGRSSRLTVPELEREIFYPVQPSAMVGIEISPDGTLLARAQWDNREVWIVDALTGDVVHSWVAHDHGVTAVKFSPDGQYLATGGRQDDALRIWRLSDQSLVREFPSAGQLGFGAISIAFSPNGEFIASASEGYGQRFRMWRVIDGQLLFETDPIDYLAEGRVRFTPDGRHVAFAERSYATSEPWSGRMRFLDVAGRQVKVDWRFPDAAGVTDFDFSPNGRYLAISEYHGILSVVLNPASGMRTVKGHRQDGARGGP
jgi:WD40 repeat protein